MRPSAVAALVRLAKAEAESRQKTLAAVVGEIATVEAKMQALEDERAAERAGADGPGFAIYAARIQMALTGLRARRAMLQGQEAALREALADAFRELKKYENLADRMAAQRSAQAEAAASAQLDETAIQRAARRGSTG